MCELNGSAFSPDGKKESGLKIKTIFHIDFDYFFAQCEEVRNPMMKKSPIIVCVYSGREQDSGVVSTSNYIARNYGVKSGLSIKHAKNKLRDTKSFFIPIDLQYYKEISNKIMNIICSFSPFIEIRGVDECYLDVTFLLGHNSEYSINLAKTIKKTIKDQTGISSSIGISFNKILAKIASDYKKPDGLFLIDINNYKEIVYPFAIDKVPGIGPKTRKKLNDIKITTIEELVNAKIDNLIKICGRKLGYKLASICHPDFSRWQTNNLKQKQIMKIMTLKKEPRDSLDFRKIIDKISIEIVSGLVRNGLVYRNISIILILENLVNITRSKSMKLYSNEIDQLILQSNYLFDEILKSIDIKDVRRIGIKVSDLKQSTGQNTLNQYF